MVGGLAAASFVPIPGYCNVSVSVTNFELSVVVGTEFEIQSISPSVTGKATALDWGGWLPAGFAWATLGGTFTERVTVGPASTSKSETQLVPSLPYLNGAQLTATDSYSLAYVPVGQQPISVTLSEGSSVVAMGSSSLNVGC